MMRIFDDDYVNDQDQMLMMMYHYMDMKEMMKKIHHQVVNSKRKNFSIKSQNKREGHWSPHGYFQRYACSQLSEKNNHHHSIDPLYVYVSDERSKIPNVDIHTPKKNKRMTHSRHKHIS